MESDNAEIAIRGDDMQQLSAEKKLNKMALNELARRPWQLISRGHPKRKPPLLAPGGCRGQSKLQVVLGFSEDHEVVGVELTVETKIRAGHEPPGEARRMAAARLLTKRLNRRGESTRPCAMPVSTKGDDTSPRAWTCESVPQRKLAIVRHSPPVTPAWSWCPRRRRKYAAHAEAATCPPNHMLTKSDVQTEEGHAIMKFDTCHSRMVNNSGGSSAHSKDHLHDTRTLLLLCPMQHRYIGQTAPHTAISCGEQVPDVTISHYRDARMQHSQK